MALKDKEPFYSRLSQRMEKQYLADMDSLKKGHEGLAQCNQEIDDTFISPYTDKAKDILTEKRFLTPLSRLRNTVFSSMSCMSSQQT